MEEIQRRLDVCLRGAAQYMRNARVAGPYAASFLQLADEIYLPCVIAVVGPVKNGKSTFINTLLGTNSAKEGVSETTATINYFRYGKLPSGKPAKCVWQNGRVEEVDQAFIDSLQGNTMEVLRKAEGIKHIDYYLQHAYLEQVTLVDTPGTGAVVDTHQERLDAFLHLSQRLRERHSQETLQIGSNADAVIYLFGEIGRAADEEFLLAFQQITQSVSNTLNAIGVMARIDLYPEFLRDREKRAARLSAQLRDSVSKVIPVSAGIERALQHLSADNFAGLKRLQQAMQTIPSEKLSKFLSDECFYLTADSQRYPIALEDRRALAEGMDWQVFVAIATLAADPSKDSETLADDLSALAGFKELRAVFNEHFFARSQILRISRILRDAKAVVESLKTRYVQAMYRQDDIEQRRQERFLRFIRQAQGDRSIEQELEDFIREQGPQTAKKAEELVERIANEIDALIEEVRQYHADFAALNQLQKNPQLFSTEELDELRAMFGLYGLKRDQRLPSGKDVDETYLLDRQLYWRKVKILDISQTRRDVAEKAEDRYQLLSDAMHIESH